MMQMPLPVVSLSSLVKAPNEQSGKAPQKSVRSSRGGDKQREHQCIPPYVTCWKPDSVSSYMVSLVLCQCLCRATTQQCKPPVLLPLHTSVTLPSRVKHLIRAAFCHAFFFLTASLDENQAVFMFILLVCLLAWDISVPQDVLQQWILVAEGLWTTLMSWPSIQDLSLFLALPLGCFQLLWSKVAAVASKFGVRILESCVCACWSERLCFVCCWTWCSLAPCKQPGSSTGSLFLARCLAENEQR